MGDDRDSKRDRKEKHSHRDRDRKDRDRDRDRESHREKDRRDRDREREKDRGDRHKSSRHEREHRARSTEQEDRRSKRKSDHDSRPGEEAEDAAAKRPRLESASPQPPQPDALPPPPAKQQAVEDGFIPEPAAQPSASPLPPPPARAPSPPAQPSNWAVQDSGGEVSMSIEETNRMRISLGLKPLSMDSSKEQEDKAARAAFQKKQAEEKQAEADLLALRVKEKKEQRLQDQKLRATKTLGQETEGDDLQSWVSKSRQLEQERARAGRMAALFQEQDDEAEDSDDDEDEATRPAPDHLAGLKVRHDAAALGEGETVIMTLADRNILDARGDLDEDGDELENVLAAEHAKREKARKAATNAGKPLWDEDGERRGILDKYDEADEDASMTVGASGRLEAKLSKADETRKRLAAAQERVQQQDAPSMVGQGDFMTADEVAFKQKGKKMRKKMRKKAADEEMVDIDALEAAADAEAPSDHGSRRNARDQAAEAASARAEEMQKRRARYENALEKANYAQLAKAQEAQAAADQAANEDDEQEALDAQLARARRAVQQRSAEEAAREAGEAAAERQRQAAEAAAADADGMTFTEAGEFARFIQPVKQEIKAEPEPSAPSVVPTPRPAASMKPPAPRNPSKKAAGGGWRGEGGAGGESGGDMMDVDMEAEEEAGPPEAKVKAEPSELPVTRQRAVGGGLSGALELLKDRGELRNTVEWAGRTSDMRSDKLEQLADVYTGGKHTDRIAADIETALTRRDEFGRVMTPKEAFRALCYKFHGKDPSKNKQEKRIRKWEEEQAVKKAAASDQSFAGLGSKPPSRGLPAGNAAKNASGASARLPHAPYAGQDTPALTPLLGGGDTPLQGKKKVAVMLGMASPHKRK